jgi:hypothetical protein
VTQTYDVGRHAAGGLEKLAPPVDAVLGEKLGRLKQFIESSPAPWGASGAPGLSAPGS